MSQQVTLPVEVASLISLVQERWGYYFGKRAVQSQLMKATASERAVVSQHTKKISALFSDYLDKGIDVREAVKTHQADLVSARQTLSVASEPFYVKIRPLNTALSFMDKIAIPKAIEDATGEKVIPRIQVSSNIVKAITSLKA